MSLILNICILLGLYLILNTPANEALPDVQAAAVSEKQIANATTKSKRQISDWLTTIFDDYIGDYFDHDDDDDEEHYVICRNCTVNILQSHVAQPELDPQPAGTTTTTTTTQTPQTAKPTTTPVTPTAASTQRPLPESALPPPTVQTPTSASTPMPAASLPSNAAEPTPVVEQTPTASSAPAPMPASSDPNNAAESTLETSLPAAPSAEIPAVNPEI